MKLPALWLAAAFAAGIALADAAPGEPRLWLGVAAAGIAAGLLCAARRWPAPAFALGLAAWLALGVLAAHLERAAVPPNHVTHLLAAGDALPLEEPLRWRGRLRSDPVRLPWGLRYEIELEEVEVAGQPLALTGGMRLSYYFDETRDQAPQPARAGDRIEALVRARQPRNFGNPGAFDFRRHLARQGIHLTATLRNAALLQNIAQPPATLAHRAARLRGALLDRLDALFAHAPEQAAVLRAMLLGDRSFIDHDLAGVFQRTAAYHVLVISGLHVAALAAFVWWLVTLVRLRRWAATLATLAVLAAFVAVVEDRPPILRAALMAAVFLASRLLFRRVELLNTIAVAAVLLLLAGPASLADPSFQLSFLAAAMIAALALPWIERTSGPYRRALRHAGDPARDAAHPPRAAQLRLDLRFVSGWLAAKLPAALAERAPAALAAPCRAAFRLWDVLLISAAVQLGMLPLMAHYFNRVTLSGPLVNIPATLLAAAIVPAGFLALAASAVWTAAGGWLVALAGGLTAAMTAAVEWFGRWTWATYRIPGPPLWLVLAFFAALVLLAWAARRAARPSEENGAPAEKRLSPGRLQLAAALPVLVLAALIAAHPFSPALEDGTLEVTVLDVGQGDAIFVAFPDGRTLLVDGGGVFGTRRGGFRTSFDIGETVVSRYLWSRGLKRLDAVVLTHAHLDHMEGLRAVLENFRVGELWVGRPVRTPEYLELAAQAQRRGARVLPRRRGEWFDWGGATALVLWPESTAEAARVSNNDSLVLRIEHGRQAFLLAGEIERETEQVLVERNDPLAADFLKIPHHGSRTSAHAAFVAAVGPRVAAISVGYGNPFGHPHREVLATLARPGVQVLRTDRDGAISVSTDGRQIQVSTYWQGGER